MFGAGGPDLEWPGYNDMPGGTNSGGTFDYSIEDEGETGPFVDPESHFRPVEQSERDVQEAINNCDRDAFRRAMHIVGMIIFRISRKGIGGIPGAQVYHAGVLGMVAMEQNLTKIFLHTGMPIIGLKAGMINGKKNVNVKKNEKSNSSYINFSTSFIFKR